MKYFIVILSACLLILISGIGYAEQQIVEGQKGQLSFSLSQQSTASKVLATITDNVTLSNVRFIEDGNDLYITGIIHNNSRAAVYGFDFDIIYYDNRGRLIEEETSLWRSFILGKPARIFGFDYISDRSASYHDPYHRDFIPAGEQAYFFTETLYDPPSNADIFKSVLDVSWVWTVKAALLEVQPIEINFPSASSSRYYDNTVDFNLLFSGSWSLTDVVENVKIYLIGLNANGAVSAYGAYTVGADRNVYPSDYQSRPPTQDGFSIRFNNLSDSLPTNRVILQIGYDLTGTRQYRDSDLFAKGGGTGTGSDAQRIARLKKGDLNEDGIVDVADFLIFTNHFGQRVD